MDVLCKIIRNIIICICVVALGLGFYRAIAGVEAIPADNNLQTSSDSLPFTENNNGDGNISPDILDGIESGYIVELPDIGITSSGAIVSSSGGTSSANTSTGRSSSGNPSSSGNLSSNPPSSTASSSITLSSAYNPSSREQPHQPVDEILKVTINGAYTEMKASEILPLVVSYEMSSSFDVEALKAQAVATHTFIKYYNLRGSAPSVGTRNPDSAGKIKNAVMQVVDKVICYNNSPIFAPYFAISAGRTNSALDVWGGAYPYLVSRESKYDYLAPNYKVTNTYSESEIKTAIESKINVTLSGNPENWMSILSKTSGNYVGNMNVGGATTYYCSPLKKTSNITGRWIREDILKVSGKTALRSASFDISYSNSTFSITTYGYGHGVGMSQLGANLYAQHEGWSYDRILKHYYYGTEILSVG